MRKNELKIGKTFKRVAKRYGKNEKAGDRQKSCNRKNDEQEAVENARQSFPLPSDAFSFVDNLKYFLYV